MNVDPLAQVNTGVVFLDPPVDVVRHHAAFQTAQNPTLIPPKPQRVAPNQPDCHSV